MLCHYYTDTEDEKGKKKLTHCWTTYRWAEQRFKEFHPPNFFQLLFSMLWGERGKRRYRKLITWMKMVTGPMAWNGKLITLKLTKMKASLKENKQFIDQTWKAVMAWREEQSLDSVLRYSEIQFSANFHTSPFLLLLLLVQHLFQLMQTLNSKIRQMTIRNISIKVPPAHMAM